MPRHLIYPPSLTKPRPEWLRFLLFWSGWYYTRAETVLAYKPPTYPQLDLITKQRVRVYSDFGLPRNEYRDAA